ncbi:hypothetical protein ACOMHN_027961 [Nucella lapillus]
MGDEEFYGLFISRHFFCQNDPCLRVRAGQDLCGCRRNRKPSPIQTSANFAVYLRHEDLNDTFSLLAKILLIFLPLLLLLILTVLTVIGLRRHCASTSKLTSTTDDVRRRQERQMTVTIFTAIVAYVALSLPQTEIAAVW